MVLRALDISPVVVLRVPKICVPPEEAGSP
jgi:hypothetical protein